MQVIDFLSFKIRNQQVDFEISYMISASVGSLNLYCLVYANTSMCMLWASKILNVIFFRKMPEKEADHLTPATRLLEKKREMAEVEQALQATKDVCI